MEETFQGQTYAAWTTAGIAVKARAGRIAKLVVTSAVTGSITIYDNPSAASGTVLFTATTPALGITVLDIPAKTGIYLVPGSAGGGILVYS